MRIVETAGTVAGHWHGPVFVARLPPGKTDRFDLEARHVLTHPGELDRYAIRRAVGIDRHHGQVGAAVRPPRRPLRRPRLAPDPDRRRSIDDVRRGQDRPSRHPVARATTAAGPM